MSGGTDKDAAVARYIVSLIGCALSERMRGWLPDECSWEDVLSRARDNGILSLVWHAARGLDGIPNDVRDFCQRFSDMVALHKWLRSTTFATKPN